MRISYIRALRQERAKPVFGTRSEQEVIGAEETREVGEVGQGKPIFTFILTERNH